jgi:hypothetical protein
MVEDGKSFICLQTLMSRDASPYKSSLAVVCSYYLLKAVIEIAPLSLYSLCISTLAIPSEIIDSFPVAGHIISIQ